MPENIKTNLETQNQPVLTKTCKKCSENKPATLEFFYKNAGGKYGLTPRCKPCVNEDNLLSHNKRFAADPERIRAQGNARAKKSYHKNLDKNREYQRNYQAKSRADPVKKLKIQSRKRAGDAGLTPEEIEVIRSQQDNKCAICGDENPTDLDHCHKTKKIRWLLCRHCNRGLGAFRDRPDLLRKAAYMLEKQNQEDKPVDSKFE